MINIPEINLTVSIWKMTVTPFFWGILIASIASSFSFWRRLKEDYKEEEIFSLNLWLCLSAFVFSRLFFVLFNFDQFGLSLNNWLSLNYQDNFSFFGACFGTIVALRYRLNKQKKNFWEILDAITLPFFYFSLFGGIGLVLKKNDWLDLIFPVVGILGLIFFDKIRKKYRSFVWYKSGKTGFLMTFFSSIIFLFLFGLAFIKTNGLYFEHWSWLLIFLISISALYYRSERNLKDDFLGLFKKSPKKQK